MTSSFEQCGEESGALVAVHARLRGADAIKDMTRRAEHFRVKRCLVVRDAGDERDDLFHDRLRVSLVLLLKAMKEAKDARIFARFLDDTNENLENLFHP